VPVHVGGVLLTLTSTGPDAQYDTARRSTMTQHSPSALTTLVSRRASAAAGCSEATIGWRSADRPTPTPLQQNWTAQSTMMVLQSVTRQSKASWCRASLESRSAACGFLITIPINLRSDPSRNPWLMHVGCCDSSVLSVAHQYVQCSSISSQPFHLSFCQAAVLSYVPTWIHLTHDGGTEHSTAQRSTAQHSTGQQSAIVTAWLGFGLP
jgi:hypothetical protein